MKKEDVIAYWKGRHERRERILEARRNSAFAKKMQPVYAFMNRFSLIFHALLACIINFTNRSNFQAFARCCLELYDRNTAGIFVQCVYDLRNLFYCISVQAKDILSCILSALWIILGIANGYILLEEGHARFNAQDL